MRRVQAMFLLLTVGFNAIGAAQTTAPRQGVWISFGPFYGPTSASCNDIESSFSGCGIDKEGSTGGFLRVGGTVNSRFLAGAEIAVLSVNSRAPTMLDPVTGELQGSPDLQFGTLTALVSFYPKAGSGLFLKGGLGISNVIINSSTDVNESGWAATVGVGYDIRVARNISVTPTLDYRIGGVGEIDAGNIGTAEGYRQSVLSGGLGITFH